MPEPKLVATNVDGRWDVVVDGDTVGYLERGMDNTWQLWIKAHKGHQLAAEGPTRLRVVEDWQRRG